MAVKQQTRQEEIPQLPPLETPDDDIVHCIGILMPILSMTINELHSRGKEGWSTFLAQVFDTINDVMAPES